MIRVCGTSAWDAGMPVNRAPGPALGIHVKARFIRISGIRPLCAWEKREALNASSTRNTAFSLSVFSRRYNQLRIHPTPLRAGAQRHAIAHPISVHSGGLPTRVPVPAARPHARLSWILASFATAALGCMINVEQLSTFGGNASAIRANDITTACCFNAVVP